MPSLDVPFELLPVRLQAVRHARRDQGRFGRAGRLRARELDRPRLPRPEGSVAPVSVAPCCWPLLSVRLTEPPCAISTKPASGREDEIVGLAGLELLERGRVGDHHVLGLRGRAALRAGSRGRGTTLIGITAVVGDLDARTESRLLEISVSACGISVLGRTHECFRPTTPKSIVADGRLRDRLPFVQRGDVEL